jgi:hypothetical protein
MAFSFSVTSTESTARSRARHVSVVTFRMAEDRRSRREGDE